jgi:hypothetical protein
MLQDKCTLLGICAQIMAALWEDTDHAMTMESGLQDIGYRWRILLNGLVGIWQGLLPGAAIWNRKA